ncbi:transglutaminase-like domain-containing protein [Gorillibacterium timonense]|uniref:transglutaminase-like domain-containing protein n=1 Tax=Gorillibacterium timonense TaxID=1689269 RepID=UPI00071C5D4A|nr:transglutaminase-like domain-containing protein [Gorillibacterium timonense]
MKKLLMIASLTLFTAAATLQPITAAPVQAAASEASWLNKDAASRGVIAVRYSIKSGVDTKLMVTKGETSYTYNLTTSGQTFPLQLGNGDYQVSVLEQASGTKYRQVKKETVNVKLDDANAVFLNSIQNVRWQTNGNAAKLAEELTKSAKTDEEKAKAIYSYIIKKINYDNKLAASGVTSDYLPDADRTLSTSKGICYDYASLYAVMLRSQKIPAKLMMGTSSYVKEYHAWNEVLLNGKWVTVDTTVDASKAGATAQKDFVKDSSKYKVAKVY